MTGVTVVKYSLTQIVLHWTVALLVLVQYATSGSISRTHEVSLKGLKVDPLDHLLHSVHNRTGMLILVLMVLRLGFRYWKGVPPPPPDQPPMLGRLANIVHLALYTCLIMQAVTGIIASYIWWPASAVHRPLFYIFATLAALHVFAAFWHQWVRRDGLLRRMMP
jgi:cytochrome b561